MTLTSKQVDAVTYAYLDICAAAPTNQSRPRESISLSFGEMT